MTLTKPIHWIPVGEEMPDLNQPVLTYRPLDTDTLQQAIEYDVTPHLINPVLFAVYLDLSQHGGPNTPVFALPNARPYPDVPVYTIFEPTYWAYLPDGPDD